MSWINGTAICPQPTFALAAALCLAGTLYGRHFKDGSGGILKQELTCKTQFIRKTFRDEYLADLVESGELVMATGSHGLETY